MTLDVRPERTAYRPGDVVRLVVDAARDEPTRLEITHLGEASRVLTVDVRPGRQLVEVGTFGAGSYAVRFRTESVSATTAFDVLSDPMARPRYGFLADFRPGRDDAGAVRDSLIAFHLNVVQLYDWMYRHAELVPPVEPFDDALGRRLSLATVRNLVEVLHSVGAEALGYAAVYGAGAEYAAAHPDQVLRHRDGSPWMLADFLWIMDVSPRSAWTTHIVAEMRRAVEVVGFDGLHLDQYGHPKVARSATGGPVDLGAAFPALIDSVRAALPDRTLIFNNVNDFPTRQTVRAQQDVTYIEVWSPHDDYVDLVRLVETAHDLAPDRPVVLAAYLVPFASAGGIAELTTAMLALATVWASGGQSLLFGEVDAVLVDPYYPRHATLDREAVRTLRAFADFSVANGDLLFGPESGATTGAMVGGVNEDVDVSGVPVSLRPEAGHVWVRTSRVGGRLVVQLVDYRDQVDTRWNEARTPTVPVVGVTVRVRVVEPEARVWFGTPLRGPELRRVTARDDTDDTDDTDDADGVTVEVPEFDAWGMLVVDG